MYDNSHTIIFQIYSFFLTNPLAIVRFVDEFAKWYFESKNALNSPDRNENPCEGWCSALTRIVMYSGKYVLKKRNHSAPKK